jgi:hypothetical protein
MLNTRRVANIIYAVGRVCAITIQSADFYRAIKAEPPPPPPERQIARSIYQARAIRRIPANHAHAREKEGLFPFSFTDE